MQVTSNRGNWAGEETHRGGGDRWSEPLTSTGKGGFKKNKKNKNTTTDKEKTILIQLIFLERSKTLPRPAVEGCCHSSKIPSESFRPYISVGGRTFRNLVFLHCLVLLTHAAHL